MICDRLLVTKSLKLPFKNGYFLCCLLCVDTTLVHVTSFVRERNHVFFFSFYPVMLSVVRSSVTVLPRSPKAPMLFPLTQLSRQVAERRSAVAPMFTALRTARVTCLTPALSWLAPSVERERSVESTMGFKSIVQNIQVSHLLSRVGHFVS